MENNATVTHMLGYLKPGQWADALKQSRTDRGINRETVIELIEEQEAIYPVNLKQDIRDIDPDIEI